MGNELRQIAPDDPVALELAEALREGSKRARRTTAPRGRRRRWPRRFGRTATPWSDERMYIVPAYRGSGVATQILDELERRARKRGFELVRPDTHERLR
jgi:GNAT superfamily N-acetyltransferase